MKKIAHNMCFGYFIKNQKSKIKRNNHFLIHHLYFFDIKHKCIITIDVKTYNQMSHGFAYLVQI